jgi:hypothetical protein
LNKLDLITIIGAIAIVIVTIANIGIMVQVTNEKERIYAINQERKDAEKKFLDTLSGWYMRFDGLMKEKNNG